LILIDERFDFARLVSPLEYRYCHDNGRPAIHPEVLIRALLISSLYDVTSSRRMCSAISENIAFRWFGRAGGAGARRERGFTLKDVGTCDAENDPVAGWRIVS